MKIEEDGKLPFLDVCILHQGNSLESTWYCKPTDTSLIMNFHSLSPKRYQRSVVTGLVYRIYRARSNWHYFHESLGREREILAKNQYHQSFMMILFTVPWKNRFEGERTEPTIESRTGTKRAKGDVCCRTPRKSN